MAILLVVACHCGLTWCAGGFVGVDVFFVLSGYLITDQLATQYRAKHRMAMLDFYKRRALRLVPAGALALLATVAFGAMVSSPAEIVSTGRIARAAAVYCSNVFLDRSSSDYFAASVQSSPLLHTWSLGVEEQFYLVWPCLILAGNGGHRLRRSLWTLGSVTGCSLVYSIYASRVAPASAFYELPARAWEFAVGGLLTLLPTVHSRTLDRTRTVVGIVGLTLVVGAGVLIEGGAGFPGWIATIPVAGTLAMLFAGAPGPRMGVGALLGTRPLQFIGARSYSWYLWHWPFVVFAAALRPGIASGGKALAAVAALGVASVSYTFLERPVRRSSYLNLRPGLSLGAAAAVTLLIVAASTASITLGRQLALDQRFREITAATIDIGDIPHAGCWSEGRSFEVKTCTFGPPQASRTIVLFGDSHALQWFNPMRLAAQARGWRLVTFLRPGCAASDINPHRLPAAVDHCREWRDRAIAGINALHPAAVVMASYNGSTLRGDSVTAVLLPVDEIRAGTRRTLERFSKAAFPIIVLRDTPLPPFNIPACVARREAGRLQNGETCDFDAAQALNAAAFSAEHEAADGLPDVHLLDLTDQICPAARCPATINGLIVYRDEDHLTGRYAASLAPALGARLYTLIPP